MADAPAWATGVGDPIEGASRMDVALESDAALRTMLEYLDGRIEAYGAVRRRVAAEIDRRATMKVAVDRAFAGVELRDAFDEVFNGPGSRP